MQNVKKYEIPIIILKLETVWVIFFTFLSSKRWSTDLYYIIWSTAQDK